MTDNSIRIKTRELFFIIITLQTGDKQPFHLLPFRLHFLLLV